MNMILKIILHKYKIVIIIYTLIFSMLGTGISLAGEWQMVPNEIVKLILQHPKLMKFIHPEVEGRVPIVIQSYAVDPNIKLIMFGKPIVVVPDSKEQLTTNIYMSFFRDGEVSITYPVEEITGLFKFVTDSEGKWKIDTVEIWEN
ncbi:hypothetical protein ACFL6W_03480 [Thermodesulfobacteriota bacterium]